MFIYILFVTFKIFVSTT